MEARAIAAEIIKLPESEQARVAVWLGYRLCIAHGIPLVGAAIKMPTQDGAGLPVVMITACGPASAGLEAFLQESVSGGKGYTLTGEQADFLPNFMRGYKTWEEMVKDAPRVGAQQIIIRPMVKNVPYPPPGEVWEKVICGHNGCRNVCWRRPIEPATLPPGFMVACTQCALQAAQMGQGG